MGLLLSSSLLVYWRFLFGAGKPFFVASPAISQERLRRNVAGER
jgi:hypothetical protein